MSFKVPVNHRGCKFYVILGLLGLRIKLLPLGVLSWNSRLNTDRYETRISGSRTRAGKGFRRTSAEIKKVSFTPSSFVIVRRSTPLSVGDKIVRVAGTIGSNIRN